MIKHRLSLHGPGVKGSRISAFLLADLLEVLTAGTRGALRLRIEGRSSARGMDPAWLGRACDFDLVGLESGSTVIEIETISLSEAAPEQFAQQKLFSNVDTQSSAFKMFEQSLQDATSGSADSDLYDEGLLQIFSRLNSVFSEGVTSFEISNGSQLSSRLILTAEKIEQVKKLRSETPPDQAVRIAGQINTIRYSDKMFELLLKSGQVLRGIAPVSYDTNELKQFFGHDVIATGKVVFRPSGSILRIEASKIEPAHGNVSPWSKAPKAFRNNVVLRELHRPQGPDSGVNRLWGKWPGAETDEEVRQALKP